MYICEMCQEAFEPKVQRGVGKLKEFNGYIVDLRLGQFRKMAIGTKSEFVEFDSPKGQKLLAQMHEQVMY